MRSRQKDAVAPNDRRRVAVAGYGRAPEHAVGRRPAIGIAGAADHVLSREASPSTGTMRTPPSTCASMLRDEMGGATPVSSTSETSTALARILLTFICPSYRETQPCSRSLL